MKIDLIEFDQDFLETIEGNEEVLIEDNGIYYVFTVDHVPAGVVGFIPLDDNVSDGNQGFVQIAIHQEFRGKGLLKPAEDALAKKHDLTALHATINQDNKASIKAHLKAGFELDDVERMQFLRENGLLKGNEIRLRKDYY